MTETKATVDNNGLLTGTGWTLANNANFAAVTNPNVPGYYVISNNAPASDLTQVATQNVTPKSGDLNYTVVYASVYSQNTKTINETINYVDTKGNTVAPSTKATPITFLTVTNAQTNATTTYYSTTQTTATLDTNGVPTGSGWTLASSANFAAVVNPNVKGYYVTSNNAPASDLTKVGSQTVMPTSSDLNFTVVYTKNAEPFDHNDNNTPSKPTKPNKPGQPGKPNRPTTQVWPVKPNQPSTPVKPGVPTHMQPTNNGTHTDVATLPKTDEQKSSIGLFAGIVGLLLAGLGFFGLKKRN